MHLNTFVCSQRQITFPPVSGQHLRLHKRSCWVIRTGFMSTKQDGASNQSQVKVCINIDLSPVRERFSVDIQEQSAYGQDLSRKSIVCEDIKRGPFTSHYEQRRPHGPRMVSITTQTSCPLLPCSLSPSSVSPDERNRLFFLLRKNMVLMATGTSNSSPTPSAPTLFNPCLLLSWIFFSLYRGRTDCLLFFLSPGLGLGS